MNLETPKPGCDEPLVAGVCLAIAWLSILIGGFILVFACSEIPKPGAGSAIGLAFAILFSSIFWFALSRALILLARIEWNTRK